MRIALQSVLHRFLQKDLIKLLCFLKAICFLLGWKESALGRLVNLVQWRPVKHLRGLQGLRDGLIRHWQLQTDTNNGQTNQR